MKKLCAKKRYKVQLQIIECAVRQETEVLVQEQLLDTISLKSAKRFIGAIKAWADLQWNAD